MISTLFITIQSVALVLSLNTVQPELYCSVQLSEGSATKPAELYKHDGAGCKLLGSEIKKEIEEQYPSTPVVLIVEGKSLQSL